MIDTKLYEAINQNNKKEHQKWIKNQKKKNTASTICIIMGILAIVGLVLVLGNVIHHETRNAVKRCVKMGYSVESCLRDAR